MKIEIVFRDEVEHDSMEDAYDAFLAYLAECVEAGDVSAFQFYELNND